MISFTKSTTLGKAFITDLYGGPREITKQINGSFFDVKIRNKSSTEKRAKIYLIYSFSETKHFVIYSLFEQNDRFSSEHIQVGISFGQGPVLQKFGHNDIPSSEKKNIINGSDEFSINDGTYATTQQEKIRQIDGTVLDSGICEENTKIVLIGKLRQCVEACPANKPYILVDYTDGPLCMKTYSPTQFIVDNPKIPSTVTINTSFNIYSEIDKYYSINSITTAKYVDSTELVDKCDDFMSPMINMFEAKEFGHCLDNCPTDYFRFSSLAYKYSTTETKKYCFKSCPSEYEIIIDDGTTKHCSDRCINDSQAILNDYYFMVDDGTTKSCVKQCPSSKKYIHPFEGNVSVNWGECKVDCTISQGYRLNSSDYQYNLGGNKDLCTQSSLGAFNKYYQTSTHKQLVKNCADSTVPNNKHYLKNTTDDPIECTNTCDLNGISLYGISNEDNITATDHNNNGECKDNCNLRILIDDQSKTYCVSKCIGLPTVNKKYMQNNAGIKECKANCDAGEYYTTRDPKYHECVPECNIDEFIEVSLGSREKDLAWLEANNSPHECISSCSENIFIHQDQTTNITKRYCLDFCPKDVYEAQISSSSYKCVLDCHVAGFAFFRVEDDKYYCEHSCSPPYKHFRKEGNNKKCLIQCESEEIIKIDLQNYSIGDINDAGSECVTNCSNDFTLNLDGKKYCITTCPIGFYWIDEGGSKICVQECGDDFPYSTPEFECIANCQAKGFAYDMEDKSCSDTCSSFVDLNIHCVAKCPKNRPYYHGNICSSECPHNKPFLFNYEECLELCPNKFYEKICVEECDEERLLEYYSKLKGGFVEKPFTLSTGECALNCFEPGFKFIDERTLKCLEECPEEEIKYRDAEFYCREKCSNPVYPYRDDITLECLDKCPEERRFVVREDQICLEKCPQDRSSVFERPMCSDELCDKSCNQKQSECVSKCPSKAIFTLKLNFVTNCVCECPQYFLAEKDNTCKLFCDPEKGLVEEGDICVSCKEDKNLVFYDGVCVLNCPEGHLPNKYGVCKTCFELGIWTNELNRCLLYSECDPLSYFNFSSRTCTKCDKEGYMLVYHFNQKPVCEQTDCSKGFILSQNTLKECFICPNDRFFFDRVCRENCPLEKAYDFVNLKCASSCVNQCTSNCCKEGSCENRKCVCNPGFTGVRCDIPVSEAKEVENRAKSYILFKFQKRLLVSNEVFIIDDLIAISESKNRLLVEDTFFSQMMLLTRIRYIKYSFQSNIFLILDRLLGLTKNASVTKLIREYARNIVIFLTSSNTVPEFEVVYSGNFQGKYFKFSFGADLSSLSSASLGDCLTKLEEKGYSHLSFILLQFNLESSQPDAKALILSQIPLIELSLVSKGKFIDLQQICSPRTINRTFEPELNEEDIAKAQKFKNTSIDVFNQNDPFFVDRCVVFSENDRDITLAERKQYQVNVSSVCKETLFEVCNVEQTKNGVECVCEGIKDKKKSSLEVVAESYPKTNYILFTCMQVFLGADFLSNNGFYIVCLPFLLALILSLLKSFKINKMLESELKHVFLREDFTQFDPKTMDKHVYFQECIDLKTNIDQLVLVNQLKSVEPLPEFIPIPTLGDYRHLSPEELPLFDRRTILQFATDSFKQLHPTVKVFFKANLRSTPTYDIMLFVTEMNLTSTMSAFFIDDSMVQKRNIEGDPSLLESLTEDTVRTTWTILTSTFILVLVKALIVSDRSRKDSVSHIILKKQSNLNRTFDAYITRHRCSLMSFIFFTVVLNSLFGYFVVIYSQLYANSQQIWLNGILVSLFMKHIVIRTTVPLILVLLRALSRKMQLFEKPYELATRLSHLMIPLE